MASRCRGARLVWLHKLGLPPKRFLVWRKTESASWGKADLQQVGMAVIGIVRVRVLLVLHVLVNARFKLLFFFFLVPLKQPERMKSPWPLRTG